MTKMIITFNIPDDEYNSYGEFIDQLISDLEDMGAEDVEVSAE